MDDSKQGLKSLANTKCKKDCLTARCLRGNISLSCTEPCLCNGGCQMQLLLKSILKYLKDSFQRTWTVDLYYIKGLSKIELH